MRKIFSLMAAALMSVAMMAQSSGMDTIAYFAFPESTYLDNTSGKNIQGTNCTVDYTGIGNNASNSQVIDGIYYLKFTSNSAYVKLKPSNGEQVKPGDSVFVVLGHSSKRELGTYLKVRETGTWISATQSVGGEIVVAKGKLTRDDINDDGTLSFYRKDGNTTFVRSFLVTRDPNAPAATHNVITYYDQNGAKLGIDSIAVGADSWTFKYGIADLPAIPNGMTYRGWYTANGRRVVAGEALEGDLVVHALVNAIEYPTSTARYIYDLTNEYFYQDDHECISITGAAYSAADKGWKCEANAVVTLTVSPFVYVSVNGQEPEPYSDYSSINLSFGQDYILKTIHVYNVTGQVQKQNGYYQIPAGDANSLLIVLNQAQAGDKIFLPNGLYDMGEAVLTPISKNNISIIGESMEGTIIKNAPDFHKEGIGTTATFLITATNTYLQDLTLWNNMDYFAALAASGNGRAVCLQDKGTQTICKNVRMLSNQDTYYSNKIGGLKYFEDCEIHGTVDFICGDGSVYFKHNVLVGEQRNANGGGANALTASNADASDKGYVFESCRVKYAENIEGTKPVMSLGRSWNNAPKCVFLNTVLDDSNGELIMTKDASEQKDKINRWTLGAMNALPAKLGEFNSMDKEGNVVSPASNNVTFVLGSEEKSMETILTADEAATYTIDYTLGEWGATAVADATQAVCEPTAEEFEPNGIYLVEANGEFQAIIRGSEFMDRFALYDGVTYTVRKANTRGGFGWKAGEEPQGISNTAAEAVKVQKIIRDGQVIILRDNKEYNIIGAELR